MGFGRENAGGVEELVELLQSLTLGDHL